MVGIGRVVFTTREHTIALEARGKGILGVTLRDPYEVRDERKYFDDIPSERVAKDMLDLAAHIIKTKSAHFNPKKFEDRYEQALKELLRKKDRGEKIEAPRDREPAKGHKPYGGVAPECQGATRDPLPPSTALQPPKRDTENTIACTPSKGSLKVPKARISTGSKPETMGGDGLTAPDQQQHDLHDRPSGRVIVLAHKIRRGPTREERILLGERGKKLPNGFAA